VRVARLRPAPMGLPAGAEVQQAQMPLDCTTTSSVCRVGADKQTSSALSEIPCVLHNVGCEAACQ